MSGSRDETLPDADVNAALRGAVTDPPLDAVDWNRLHADIVNAAQPRLDRSSAMLWWEPLARWTTSRTLAAAVAALVLMLGVLVARSAPDATSAAGLTVEDELVAGIPEAQLPLLFADADVDALLHLVLYYDGEEW